MNSIFSIFYFSIYYYLKIFLFIKNFIEKSIIENKFFFREFGILGLVLVAIGTGGIKPCVSAFGGDQFVLPQQEASLIKFFSLFYFAINSGSLISTFITPIFREDIPCFGQKTCYSLAFFVPAVLMALSLGVTTSISKSKLKKNFH